MIDWVGYDANDQSWEPVANVAHADEAVAAFHIDFPNKPGPQISTYFFLSVSYPLSRFLDLTGGYC